jgi:hypothetical protein
MPFGQRVTVTSVYPEIAAETVVGRPGPTPLSDRD